MDFTACQENKLYMYGGGNGKKIGITYDGAVYMLKFPPAARNKTELSSEKFTPTLPSRSPKPLGIDLPLPAL